MFSGVHLECSTGMEHRVMMLPMMMASLREHVPDSHSGSRIPAHTHRETETDTHTHQCYTITVVNNALNSLLFSAF